MSRRARRAARRAARRPGRRRVRRLALLGGGLAGLLAYRQRRLAQHESESADDHPDRGNDA